MVKMTDKEVLLMITNNVRRHLQDFVNKEATEDVRRIVTEKINKISADMLKDKIVGDLFEWDVQWEANGLKLVPMNAASVSLMGRATIKD